MNLVFTVELVHRELEKLVEVRTAFKEFVSKQHWSVLLGPTQIRTSLEFVLHCVSNCVGETYVYSYLLSLIPV